MYNAATVWLFFVVGVWGVSICSFFGVENSTFANNSFISFDYAFDKTTAIIYLNYFLLETRELVNRVFC